MQTQHLQKKSLHSCQVSKSQPIPQSAINKPSSNNLSKSQALYIFSTMPKATPLRVYSCKKIDITYPSLLSGLLNCLSPSPPPPPFWHQGPHAAHFLATLNARAGLSALLSALDFPQGSEIILSAITIPSIPLLIRAHGLVPVPIDVCPDTTVAPSTLARAITPRTRMVLVAQLFGARWDLSSLVEVTRAHDLLLVEDCAQGFVGGTMEEGLARRSGADVSFFSFGPIKTCSALGGGLVFVPDEETGLLKRMEAVQEGWARQSTMEFAVRVVKFAVFKTIAGSPWLYGLLLAILAMLGIESAAFITDLGRNVAPGQDLLRQIQRQPCSAQLQLLDRAVKNFDEAKLKRRRSMVECLVRWLPQDIRPIGYDGRMGLGIETHYWLCPIRVRMPQLVIEKLLEVGIDAADGGTSLVAVDAKAIVEARKMMSQVVYLPIDHYYDDEELLTIARILRDHGHSGW